MAQIQVIQNTFHAGELSPRLFGRTNTERYAQSLAECENFLTVSHGPARLRDGFEFIDKTRVADVVRLIPFEVDLRESYAIEVGWDDDVGESYMRFYDRDGLITGSPPLTVNSSFANGLVGWDTTTTNGGLVTAVLEADAVQFDIVRNNSYAEISQEVTIPEPTNVHRLDLIFHSDQAGTPFRVRVGTTDGGSELGEVFFGAGEYDFEFTPGVSPIYVAVDVDQNYADVEIGGAYYADLVMVRDITDIDTVLELTLPWDEEEVANFQYAQSGASDVMYFAAGKTIPQKLTYGGGRASWTFEPTVITGAPPEWAENNYPQCVTFYQQRLWFARTANERDKLWGSQSADFENFDVDAGQNPTDAIDFQLADRGSIQWIAGAKDLLIGTDVAEYLITSAEGVVIPTDIQTEQQSAYGSAFIQPVEVGNGVIYVSPDTKRVRFMNYQFLEDGWVSVDLTWASEHVTAGGIKEIHFRYSPDPLMWLVLRDGTLVSCMYEREQELIGWHRQLVSDETPLDMVNGWTASAKGFVKDIAVLREAEEAVIYAAIRRDVGGDDAVYVEKLRDARVYPPGVPGGQVGQAFDDGRRGHLDSHIRREYADPVTTVDGLDHLEGKRVRVMNGMSLETDKTVVNGAITLDQPGRDIEIGLGFLGTLRTLPLEGINNSGTAQALIRRWSRVFVRLVASAIPLVNGVRTGERSPATPMDTAEPTRTQDLQVAHLGRDRIAEVTVQQDLPVRTTVIALFGDAGASKL